MSVNFCAGNTALFVAIVVVVYPAGVYASHRIIRAKGYAPWLGWGRLLETLAVLWMIALPAASRTMARQK